jgi:hypothetical protein
MNYVAEDMDKGEKAHGTTSRIHFQCISQNLQAERTPVPEQEPLLRNGQGAPSKEEFVRFRVRRSDEAISASVTVARIGIRHAVTPTSDRA